MTLNTAEIQIRDPYVLPRHEEGIYWLFGSTDPNIWSGQAIGFDCYRSSDLVHWEGPYPAFRAPEGFWSQTNYWAPEVHPYKGRFYMFATFGSPERTRGTQILVADQPQGPYVPHSQGPVTPDDWECLDGTLTVDDAGDPWMVFCHEWVQVTDGTVCAVRLTEDLSAPVGDPVTLFAASSAPWVDSVTSPRHGTGWVTDGPYVWREKDGALVLLWSSFRGGQYAQGLARSASGQVSGPWEHQPEPLYESDGGHGMLFTTRDDRVLLTLHTPNDTPHERAVFVPLIERGGWLSVDPDAGEKPISG